MTRTPDPENQNDFFFQSKDGGHPASWLGFADRSVQHATIYLIWIYKCWQQCLIIAFSQVITGDNLIVKGQTICLHCSIAYRDPGGFPSQGLPVLSHCFPKTSP